MIRREFLSASASALLIPKIIIPKCNEPVIINGDIVNREAAFRLVKSPRSILRRCKLSIRIDDRFIRLPQPKVTIKDNEIIWSHMRLKCLTAFRATFIRLFDDRRQHVSDCNFYPVCVRQGDILNISYSFLFNPRLKEFDRLPKNVITI